MGCRNGFRSSVCRALVSLLCVFAGGSVVAGQARAVVPTLTSSPLSFSSPSRIDEQAPFAHPWSLTSLSCPTTTLCVGADEEGNLLTTTDPEAPPTSWDRFNIASTYPADVACPSASFCVAIGFDTATGAWSVLTSDDPAGGSAAWHMSDFPRSWYEPESLTCPTANFCAALTVTNTIATTTDPAGGASTWTQSTYTNGSESGGSLTCASESLCLISAGAQTLFTSTHPTDGVNAWSATPGIAETRYSCPTVHLCVGISPNGVGVSVSTDPTGGAGAWTDTDLDLNFVNHGSAQITCSADSFCVALDPDGSVWTTRDPEGGATAWTQTQQAAEPPGDEYTWTAPASCPDDGWCAAATGAGGIAISQDPTGPAGSWPSHSVDGYNSLTGVSCISDGDCVAVDDAGNVLTSDQPELAAPWNATHVDSVALTGVSCIPGGSCVAVDRTGDVLTSDDPSGGAGAWSTSAVDPGNDIVAVSCASGPICMAVDESGNALLSTDPTGGVSDWQVDNVIPPGVIDSFMDVSCADTTLCVLSETAGVEVVQNPGQTDSVWSQVAPGYGPVIPHSWPDYTSVSCPSASFCVTVDLHDGGMVTEDPTGGGLAWTTTLIPSQGFTNAVACHSETLCVYAGSPNVIYETSDPVDKDALPWGQATLGSENGADQLTGASCPSAEYCIVVGNHGDAWSGEGGGYVAPSPTPAPAPGGSTTSGGGGAGGTGAGTPQPSSPTTGPGGSGSPAVPAGRGPASVHLRLRSLAFTHSGRQVRARVTCSAPSGRCIGTLSLSTRSSHPWVIATAHYDIRAGRTATISLTLSRRTETRLRRHRGRRLVVEAVVRSGTGAGRRSRVVVV